MFAHKAVRPAGTSTLGQYLGSRGAVLRSLRAGLPLDTDAMPDSVRASRKSAARAGDSIVASLHDARQGLVERMRVVELCPVCGEAHDLWKGEYEDRGELNDHSHIRVRYFCPTEGEWTDGMARARGRVLSFVLPNGGVRQVEDPRWIREDQMADPAHIQGHLMKCSRDAVVRRRKGGGLMAVPMGCGNGMCPRCAHNKAAARCERYMPYVEELVAAGCMAVHVTLTQPADVYMGDDLPTTGPMSASVAGESLGSAYTRMHENWYSMRNSRAVMPGNCDSSREWFSRTIVGNVVGTEVTGKAKGKRGRRRYHVHKHVLVLLAPGALDDAVRGRVVRCSCGERHTLTEWQVTDSGLSYWCPKRRARAEVAQWSSCLLGGSWWDRWLAEWERVCPGMRAEAQYAHIVDTGEDQERAVREVLKYPFKPADFSLGQVLEWAATLKGRTLHCPGGGLHGASRLRKAAAGDADALARLAPHQVPLVEPLQRAVARVEEADEEAETEKVVVDVSTSLQADNAPQGIVNLTTWQPASVRTMLDVADRSDGWVLLTVEREEGVFDPPWYARIEDVMEDLVRGPPDRPPDDPL